MSKLTPTCAFEYFHFSHFFLNNAINVLIRGLASICTFIIRKKDILFLCVKTRTIFIRSPISVSDQG